MPDVSAVNAQLDNLLQPGDERVEPAAEYEARDASHTIKVTVDAQRRLSDVDIQLRWSSRVPADQLAGVLFDTYIQAIQRAMVVELANAADPQPAHLSADIPVDDVTGKSFDEWIAGIRARISDIDTRLEAIERAEAGRSAPEATDVRSPLGFFLLHLRGGDPTGVSGSANILARAGADRLRQDFLEMFAAAGLAAPTAALSQPAPHSPAGEGDDEEPFEFRYDE
ncbi:hypothetical protein [Amycolatopsis solani]|uniref:hypothetical protein n=1 Tax=Amycolatopsis solani TaxID=3028615 RepID=UPI0025B2602A|nr:hypothetical protein [Amycolatopsis sp. MEP2-6]